MAMTGNTTDGSAIFLLDYVNESFLRTVTENEGSFQGTKSDIGPRSLGLGIPDTFVARRIVHYCFGTILALIGVVGTLGNVLVLYVFTRYRRLRGGGGPLILSLASGDLMVSVWHFMPAYSSFTEVWSFGDLGCQIYAASVGLGGMASLITLSVIAADRFSVIMGKPMPWLSGKKTCLCIWIFSLILVIPPFLGWSKYQREGLETSCSWDYTTRTWNNRSYYIFILFLGFVVPVAVIIVSYVGILRVVCQHSDKMNGVTRNGIIHNKKRPTKNDLRTAQVILKIIVCFLISWTPYAFVSLIGQFGNASSLTPLGTALPAIFAKASVIYNPIVYGLSHPHFRSAIQTLKAHHFPNGRHYGPNDRYRYHLAGHAAGYAGRRQYTRDGQVKFTDETQRYRKDLQRGFSTSNSESRSDTLGQGMSMRTFSSRMSGTDVRINRKGWILVRRFSEEISSDLITGHSCTAGVDEFGELSGVDSAVQSEPDLVPDDMEVHLPECININDNCAEKKQLIRTSFFRSENCLENLLKDDKSEFVSFVPGEQKVRPASSLIISTQTAKLHECSIKYEQSLVPSLTPTDITRIELGPSEINLCETSFVRALTGAVVIERVCPTASKSTIGQLKHSLSIGNFLSSSHRSPYSNPRKCSPRGLKSGGHHAYDRNDVVQLRRSKCVKKLRRAQRANNHSPASSPLLISFQDMPNIQHKSFVCKNQGGAVPSSSQNKCPRTYCGGFSVSSREVSNVSIDARGGNEIDQTDLRTKLCLVKMMPTLDFPGIKVDASLQKSDLSNSMSETESYVVQDAVSDYNCERQRCPCKTCGDVNLKRSKARTCKNTSLDSACITSCSEEDSATVCFNEEGDGDQQSLHDSLMKTRRELSDTLRTTTTHNHHHGLRELRKKLQEAPGHVQMSFTGGSLGSDLEEN